MVSVRRTAPVGCSLLDDRLCRGYADVHLGLNFSCFVLAVLTNTEVD